MKQEDEKVTLWTSVNSERSGVNKIEGTINQLLQQKIQDAFVTEVEDSRIKGYTSVQDDVGLAKLF